MNFCDTFKDRFSFFSSRLGVSAHPLWIIPWEGPSVVFLNNIPSTIVTYISIGDEGEDEAQSAEDHVVRYRGLSPEKMCIFHLANWAF